VEIDKERREHSRLNKELKVDVRRFVYPIKSQRIIKTKCLNISPGGILLEVSEKFKKGEKLQLTLYVPGLNKQTLLARNISNRPEI